MPVSANLYALVGSIKSQLQALKAALPASSAPGNTTNADETDLTNAYSAMTNIETRWYAIALS